MTGGPAGRQGKTVWFDCYGGASGDMLLGALLDAGADPVRVNDALGRLGLGLRLETARVRRAGLAALKATVMIGEGPADPAEAAPGPGRRAPAPPPVEEARDLAAITALLGAAGLPEAVAEAAIRVFRRLAEAEARVHGRPVDQVHFHEVGAADSIGDIVGTVAALADLGAGEVRFGPLPTGSGVVRTAHGELPVPAPAALELLTGLEVWDPGVRHEMVTPTGAALLVALGRQASRLPPLRVLATGTGAGTRDPARANVVRAIIGEAAAPAAAADEAVVLAETNLDDTTGQVVAAACEALLREGALDAWWTACGMKKGRPGAVLSWLARPEDSERLARRAFAEVPTLGVRYATMRRWTLDRRHVTVETPFGPVRVKLGEAGGAAGPAGPAGDRDRQPDLPLVATPEFDDCQRAAERAGVPVRQVIAAAQAAAWRLKE